MEDLTGRKFGRLLVEGFAYSKNWNRFWYCICDCGTTKTVQTALLKGGHTKSCGCLSSETTAARNFVHGHTTKRFSPTYHSWAAMIQRCTNPKRPYYKYYGGKGIKVCERWVRSFEAFLTDMGERPTGLTLDRIDSEKDYTPENCRWATLETQARHGTEKRQRTYDSIVAMCETPQLVVTLSTAIGVNNETIREAVRVLRAQGLVTTDAYVKQGRTRSMLITTKRN